MDMDGQHLTVEYVMFESRDSTSMLSVTPMEQDEVLKLFRLDMILLNSEENVEEWRHLSKDVVAVGVGRVLARLRPEVAGLLAKYLPRRHRHMGSGRELVPADMFIETPYPYQETLNSDTVLLCLRRQRKYLQRVASWRGESADFLADLVLLEDAEAEMEDRVAAEERVKQICLEYGEDISHGDLLTVAMQENARLIMAGSVTAFGRLEFLGGMRLGLMHLHMKKVCVDMAAMMPSLANVNDQGSLAWHATITGKNRISNKTKDIKKNDSSYEEHKQFFCALAEQALGNLLDNALKEDPELLSHVKDEKTAVESVVTLLDSYGVLERMLYQQEYHQERPTDDLFCYYRELIVRYLPTLALDMCLAEGDAEGLLAIEKIMVVYFVGSSLKRQDVKYSDYTLYDIVLLLSSSERTQARMRERCVINVSGTAGGGQPFDMVCEHVVRSVKGCMHRQHGGVDDILVENDVGGLSVIQSVNQHYRMSLLRANIGKEHSHDYVSDPARMIMEEQIKKLDPFSSHRADPVRFTMAVRGDPYSGLLDSDLDRFLSRKKLQWEVKHQK
jgi:hypothetical protein